MSPPLASLVYFGWDTQLADLTLIDQVRFFGKPMIVEKPAIAKVFK